MSLSVQPIDHTSDSECDQVAAVIDLAFVQGDSWFKKEGCKNRCPTGKSIKDLISTPTTNDGTTFLVARLDGTAVGAVRVDWTSDTNIGHFGMLGVPVGNGGKGVGKALVAAVIEFLGAKQQTLVSMPVVMTKNDRLIKWYEKQQFKCIGEPFDFPAPEIVLEEHKGKIIMIQMRRDL